MGQALTAGPGSKKIRNLGAMMSKRLEKLFDICGGLTDIAEQLVELGLVERSQALTLFNQELYNQCLDVENAEAGVV